MKKTKFIYYFIGIFIILSFHLSAQTLKMEYNHNIIPWNDTINPEIKKQFKNENKSKKEILVITKQSNDSLFSIFVYNNTKDSLNIELQDRSLFLIQEAKTPNGEWKPIEYWAMSNCGNSFKDFKISSNEILRTKTLKYKGDFKTQIRFKLYNSDKVYYSNSLSGSININQFKIPEDIYESNKYKLLTKRYNGDELFKKILFLDKGFSKEWKIKHDDWWSDIMKKKAELNKNRKK